MREVDTSPPKLFILKLFLIFTLITQFLQTMHKNSNQFFAICILGLILGISQAIISM